MYVCMYLRMSVCPCVCVPVCLYVCMSVCLSVCIYACMCAYTYKWVPREPTLLKHGREPNGIQSAHRRNTARRRHYLEWNFTASALRMGLVAVYGTTPSFKYSRIIILATFGSEAFVEYVLSWDSDCTFTLAKFQDNGPPIPQGTARSNHQIEYVVLVTVSCKACRYTVFECKWM